MNENTYVVVMAGGIGSRFWPISRVSHPKQFHDVLGTGESMLQTTVKRFATVCPPENIYVVTNREYASLVREHLPELPESQLLQEPIGRNTAPCIAYACYKIAKKNPSANIVIAPADHVILREDAFISCVKEGLAATANQDILVTLGIKPTRPDTNYGYIQFIDEPNSTLKKVKTFTEKPSVEIAQMFLDSGEFVWNAGIFIWNAKAIIKAFQQYLNEMADTFEEGTPALDTDQEEQFINTAYSHCRNISIDYGVMEKANNVFVILGDFGWSDLGTWNSLYSLSEKNIDDNVVNGNVLLYDVHNSIIRAPENHLVVAQGLDGYIIAQHDNILMICRREDEHKIKDFVADAKAIKGQNYI
ncbi:mannose-1-phosphate guanylyltransferase [Rufibacter quisquiliarum]|uniref:mannose-1-phosphate guanylyltransferase n=1 Tax=Rufibacter quisquiliarum TaxID=1549639 RepID=A0A839GJI7_9BACT|nr:mannose-1-phosphate guanylyltransferase [Rufibacter quisquiliarum]MBA9076929.1 mannose-1-phosphate guanylyltransferase [Rufibacter quisquiliarum]